MVDVSDLESQLWVNTLFRGRQIAEFLAVKKHLGIQSNTDVVRHLVHKQARALRRPHRPSQTSSPQPATHVSHAPVPLDRDGQEKAGLLAGPPSTRSDIQSLCLSCPLSDCDEIDPRCRYQQATGQRAKRNHEATS